MLRRSGLRGLNGGGGRWGEAIAAYAGAVAIGIAAMATLVPVGAMTGGGVWRAPPPDLAQSLAAHLEFQRDPWRWPLLFANDLYAPRGIAIVLSDANPLVSLAAKLWTRVTGRGPVDLLAPFLALALVAQAPAAVFGLRGLGTRGVVPALAAATLATSWPALLARLGHVNLCLHAVLLASLGIAFRLAQLAPDDARARRGWWAGAVALLAAAVLVHPYLFLMSVAVLAAVPLERMSRAGWRAALPEFGRLVPAVLVPPALIGVLAGTLGGGDRGFGYFSMNLLSPIVPQRSGLFGPHLRMIDATGGQYEGFAYLGAGALLLVLVALAGGVWRRTAALGIGRGFAAVFVGLTLLALSNRVFVGHLELIDLGAKPWEDLFGIVRASGRAFWPVGYAILLLAVDGAARVRPVWFARALLAAACLLEVLDAQPLRADGRRFLAGGAVPVVPAIPAGTALFTVIPLCTVDDADAGWRNGLLLVAASRAGAALGDVPIGRQPPWFNCTRIEADGLEWPLLSGEVRAFTEAAFSKRIRTAAFGADAACRRYGTTVLCGRGVSLPPGGAAVQAGAAVETLPADGRVLDGDALRGLLSTDWAAGPGGAWMEGSHGSIEAMVAPGRALEIALSLRGVGLREGAFRQFWLRVGRDAPIPMAPLGEAVREVRIAVSAQAVRDGVLTIGIDVRRPVDPDKFGIAAPVRRASLVLSAVAATTAR